MKNSKRWLSAVLTVSIYRTQEYPSSITLPVIP